MEKAENARSGQLAVIGILLCLLTVLFAFEAKSAWYVSANASTLQISTAKMQVADADQLAVRALTSSLPTPHSTTLLELAFLALIAETIAVGWIVETLQSETLPIKFFRHIFCRPPPLS